MLHPVCLALNSIMFLLIPVCSCSLDLIPTTFKFHYVSINSSSKRNRILYSVLFFKFHYVSINSVAQIQFKGKNYYSLNSIMFLLILSHCKAIMKEIMTLNSIMFLLILPRHSFYSRSVCLL